MSNSNVIKPEFRGPMDPVHPCRQIPTRHCPAIYQDVCGDRPCARYESQDETPWLPELPATPDVQLLLDDLAVLAQVGRMYLDALDADPEHELLTLTEAYRVTMVREAVERAEARNEATP